MLIGDFHIHTKYSDGRLSLAEVVDYYGQREFDVIAITDHLCDSRTLCGLAANYLDKTLTPTNFNEYIEDILSEAERARHEYGMIVLPGVEITKNSLLNSRSAHLLAIDIQNFINPILDPYDVALNIQEQGGLCVAAHPVWTRKMEPQTYHLWDHREELSGVIDAWEVASGPHLFKEVSQSGLPMIANSDFHHPQHMTSWKTLLDSKKNSSDILHAIRQQKLKFAFYEDIKKTNELMQKYA